MQLLIKQFIQYVYPDALDRNRESLGNVTIRGKHSMLLVVKIWTVQIYIIYHYIYFVNNAKDILSLTQKRKAPPGPEVASGYPRLAGRGIGAAVGMQN
jgi:hypothetical protein